jgi:type IV secretory pathway VirD2 relaxase
MPTYTKHAFISVTRNDGTTMDYDAFEHTNTDGETHTRHCIIGRANKQDRYRKMDLHEIDDFDFCIIMDALNNAPETQTT